ncbi:MAG: tetratricopeptide repeat protein [Bacteroidales bacterium]|nr:tetratricopeptide repeat protein [Bacteroidales bacterium]
MKNNLKLSNGVELSLTDELKLSRSIDNALKQDDIIDLRMKLLAVYNENKKAQPEVPVIRLFVKKFWYAAASLILLAAIGSTLFFNMQGSSPNEQLFKEYYSTENLINVTRSGDANIVEAVMKFQEGDYTTAEQLFRQILDAEPANYSSWFYYGISCMETGHYDLAENAFSTIITEEQNLYVEHAEWYLGLSALKSNQTDRAKEQLQKIAQNPDNIHSRDARKLLAELGK